MREIYKMLISVFMILTLTSTIGIAVKPTPTPDSAEQAQDARLTALETNGTLQQINNSEQQGLISELVSDVNTIKNQILSLIDQISSLSNRVTNLENSPGIPGYEIVSNKSTFVISPYGHPPQEFYANCPSGKKVVGGGFAADPENILHVRANKPTSTGEAWYIYASNSNDLANQDITVYAICVDV